MVTIIQPPERFKLGGGYVPICCLNEIEYRRMIKKYTNREFKTLKEQGFKILIVYRGVNHDFHDKVKGAVELLNTEKLLDSQLNRYLDYKK